MARPAIPQPNDADGSTAREPRRFQAMRLSGDAGGRTFSLGDGRHPEGQGVLGSCCGSAPTKLEAHRLIQPPVGIEDDHGREPLSRHTDSGYSHLLQHCWRS